jgi:hypothetical protein
MYGYAGINDYHQHRSSHITDLLLIVIHLFPLRAEELANLAYSNQINPKVTVEDSGEERTEPGIGVFTLDPLSPVLAEEHVSRQSTLGRILVLRSLFAASCLLALLGGLTLQRMGVCVRIGIAADGPHICAHIRWWVEGTLGLVLSFGIYASRRASAH